MIKEKFESAKKAIINRYGKELIMDYCTEEYVSLVDYYLEIFIKRFSKSEIIEYFFSECYEDFINGFKKSEDCYYFLKKCSGFISEDIEDENDNKSDEDWLSGISNPGISKDLILSEEDLNGKSEFQSDDKSLTGKKKLKYIEVEDLKGGTEIISDDYTMAGKFVELLVHTIIKRHMEIQIYKEMDMY